LGAWKLSDNGEFSGQRWWITVAMTAWIVTTWVLMAVSPVPLGMLASAIALDIMGLVSRAARPPASYWRNALA
jgi:hypothetical protein